jgi:hypothetical protein
MRDEVESMRAIHRQQNEETILFTNLADIISWSSIILGSTKDIKKVETGS